MEKTKKVYLSCKTPSGKDKIFSFKAANKKAEDLPGFNYSFVVAKKQEKKEGG